MEQYLYVMLSRTGTGIGKTIRLFSRCEYNHVSLGLDPSFRSWVSFARYVQSVPLAGGFVAESAERYFDMPGPVPVKIFRLPLTQERYTRLEALFRTAGDRSSGLIYNTVGLMATAMGCHYDIPGAYTCLDFAGRVLEKNYGSLAALERDLEAYLICEGDFKDLVSDDGCREDAYFTRRGFRRGTLDTARHFGRLLYRAAVAVCLVDPLQFLNL